MRDNAATREVQQPANPPRKVSEDRGMSEQQKDNKKIVPAPYAGEAFQAAPFQEDPSTCLEGEPCPEA
jgi:hypothetical protein